MELKTERLTLKPLTDEELRALRDAADAEMRQAYGEMLEGALTHPRQRLWYTAWGMYLNGERIGDLCFKGVPREGMAELGYGIAPPWEGKGYTTEAAACLVDWAFAQPGVEMVEGETEPGNAASRRILQKLGFLPCGMGAEGPRFRRMRGL